MSCCNHRDIDCRQGRACPARIKPEPALNTHGTTGNLADDTGLLICQGIALIVFVVSMIFYACH